MNSLMSYPNVLSISGSGQNAGKTTLACDIISKFSPAHEITGLKITSHIHSDTGRAKTLYSKAGIILMEETSRNSSKDTSRMLAAGAHKSFLLQVRESDLEKGVRMFFNTTGNDNLIVCESGKLLNILKPGISLFIRLNSAKKSEKKKENTSYSFDRLINFTGKDHNFDPDTILIHNNQWTFKRDI